MAEDPQVLTPELLHSLRRDSIAQAEVEGEIVGIDFDPFLGTQDPCERYLAEEGQGGGTPILVVVYPVCAGQQTLEPAVEFEMVAVGDRWQISNVRYPQEGGHLLEVLRSLHGDS